MRKAQFSRGGTYAYHSFSVELYMFSPYFFDAVGSCTDHLLPVLWSGTSELGSVPFQHADMIIRQCNFLARVAA
jgi:hypothetical protein